MQHAIQFLAGLGFAVSLVMVMVAFIWAWSGMFIPRMPGYFLLGAFTPIFLGLVALVVTMEYAK
jgi:hypothetical protein